MRNFFNKVLSASLVFVLVLIMGVFAIFAEAESSEGIHVPEAAICVHSPITDKIGHEIFVNAHSLFGFCSHDAIRTRVFNTIQCEDANASHQEQIDRILTLICEHGIDSISDLTAILQTLQNESDYAPIFPCSCGNNNCSLFPVWVTIGGVTRPAYMCMVCGRIFFAS